MEYTSLEWFSSDKGYGCKSIRHRVDNLIHFTSIKEDLIEDKKEIKTDLSDEKVIDNLNQD
ncbi:MAG: hypothetical protein Q4P34_07600 [Tissierellia bacterium]|nr:hypothetical protein [Tissierellia bacterium]